MKTRRSKRSEPFWPSIVMKKWLNIKPKVYDFSEDENDTETESEDDACSVKDVRTCVEEEHDHGMAIKEADCRSEIPETVSRGYELRHRRGKSETLRAQYINTKDVRVTIGTWNVAGRRPNDDLDIDDWLCAQDPADIYIIGFQEVVPLNAGNVLGAEDRGPIPKWEAIIRKTLNKSLEEPQKLHKCQSAPPSPVLRTDSIVDSLVEKLDANSLDWRTDELVDLDTGKNLQVKKTNGSDFDWPEQPLDENPQIIESQLKLRRVWSSNARLGFNLREKENPLVCSPSSFTCKASNLKKSRSSETLGLMWRDIKEETHEETMEDPSDVSDGSSEGEDEYGYFYETPIEQKENEVNKDRPTRKPYQKYIRIVGKQMVGIYVSVWVRKSLRRHINNLKVSPVGIGLMGYMGNKGSVSISMSLFQSRMCFVCSHLTSGQKDGAEDRRNADVYEIIRRTRFASTLDTDQPQTIPSHDQIFWFGDLNYRLNMLDADVRKLVASKQWDELINGDQLIKELRSGHVFSGWKEGPITFPPTYKYEFDSNRYAGENPKEGEKKRAPAWCDRILWLGKGIKQMCYKRSEIRFSDHRPVSSVFLVEVEVFDHRKLQRALNINKSAVHPEPTFL